MQRRSVFEFGERAGIVGKRFSSQERKHRFLAEVMVAWKMFFLETWHSKLFTLCLIKCKIMFKPPEITRFPYLGVNNVDL